MSFPYNIGAQWLFERPARNQTVADLQQRLIDSGKQVEARIDRMTDRDRETVTHIIGIERWGQRRLRVALGEPFIAEEYDSYRPVSEDDLKACFAQIRQETVALAESLHDPDPTLHIPHNQFGDLSVKGWLKYLDFHASVTSRLIGIGIKIPM